MKDHRPAPLADDCFLHDRDRLRHEEALAILKERTARVVASERVPLADADGRILAEEITAPRNVPGFDNSAVDGYAFRHEEHAATGGFFPLAGRLAAGHPAEGALPPFSAARIFTGAPMPERADTVAMQEDCERHSQEGQDFVVVPTGLRPGANRRRAGEDLAEGGSIAAPGTRLSAPEIAAIASIGKAEVKVFEKVRVALLSSGDEIVRPGEELPAGGIYDANHFLLSALLKTLPVVVSDLGIVPDRAGAVEERLATAAASHHAVIATGGASRGEEDHLVGAWERLGKRHLWQLAIKPGRPMSFGEIGEEGRCAALGLPGNPVAAFVCFLLYARPVLMKLAGADWAEPLRLPVAAGFNIDKKKPDRREFLRGRLVYGPDGGLVAEKFPRDGSGLITGLREANGLIELDEEVTRVSKGEQVTFLPFAGFGL
ncbi:molybdopterin molybdotransferase MoeA [Afifella pfennigii]|uniref:molybdopterin molybdotransferase MoeA n=1 Tax=Afifella pfennigii TaxID=209897 RepID=UPI0004790E71|nr:gephyrin-like molybdotransferase Glp [Afifella pfennigii]